MKAQNEQKGSKYKLRLAKLYLNEKYSWSGTASGHYFYQDLLVAQKIFRRQPTRHVDVGSRIDGFVAHVAAFRTIEVLDIRPPPPVKVSNIVFRQYNMMDSAMPLVNYCDSVSCLHALEHFGLGRYGDPIDIEGHLRGFDNLFRILQPGGILYLSVPIGPERIEFNAHRVFSVTTVLDMARDRFELVTLSYVDDKGELHGDVPRSAESIVDNFGCNYGCGIFELRKIQ